MKKKNKPYLKYPIILLLALLILLVLLFILLFNVPGNVPGSKPVADANFSVEVVAKNLDTPWAIDFLPDGRLIFTERSGKVSVVDSGRILVAGMIAVSEVSESGLLGIAVDPEFSKNKFIYLYYTHEKGNRVSSFVLINDRLQDEKILLDNIPSAQFHDGGRLKFGPDNRLYAATGDATVPSSAQDTTSLSGKILRINRDGSIPKDNPFGNYVYSFGHRNPQGIAWNPATNQFYASEHGPSRNDEINLIVAGGNYGWPQECSQQSNDSMIPIRCYTEFTLAPSGIAFYKNSLYVAGLRGAQLRRIMLSGDGKTILSEEAVLTDLGRIRDVVEKDGYLYIATSNRDGRGIPKPEDDKIIRVALKDDIR